MNPSHSGRPVLLVHGYLALPQLLLPMKHALARHGVDAHLAELSPLCLGDVRGLGLIAGIELVKNQETKEKFSESSNEMMYLNKGLQDRGLLTRASHIISLSPPLCITKDEVERIVAIIDDAVGDLEQRFGFA